MKIRFQKLSVLALVAVFVVSAIVCCCFTRTVQADEVLPACHQSAQGKKASHDQECECCKSKLQADYLSKVSFNAVLSVLDFSPLEFLLQSCSVIPSKFHLAYLNGPPGPTSEIPLYVHFHNFRI
jgi:hypothetical protein